MTRSRLLVLGASGMLGHKLLQVASTDHDVFGTVRTALPGLASLAGLPDEHILPGVDVAAPLEEVLERVRPDVVINCAGKIVAPGLIDMRAFVGEPGASYRETFASASQAASWRSFDSFSISSRESFTTAGQSESLRGPSCGPRGRSGSSRRASFTWS